VAKGKKMIKPACIWAMLTIPSMAISGDDLMSLYTEMRCDQALPMIATAINNEQSFFSSSESTSVRAFLVGLGLLARHEPPKNEKVALGAAYGALVFYCESEPSRTIFELVERNLRG